MKLKRVLAGAAVAVAAVACLSVSAVADTGDTWESDGYRCEELEDGTLSIYYIGDGGYDYPEEEIIIPSEINGKTVTEIAEYGFGLMPNLKSVTIPDTIRKIGDYAFQICPLTSIDIPASVTEIGDFAFDRCTSLVSVNMSHGLEKIGQQAFGSCYSLTAIDIPDSVTEIGLLAFFNCWSLTGSVEISNNVMKIGNGAFGLCSSLGAVNVDEKNLYYTSIDGVLFDKDITTLLCYPGRKEDEEYTVPDSVARIVWAAVDCSSLKALTIPANVIEIEFGAILSSRDGLIIYGYVGSAAEEYAKGVRTINFVAILVSLKNNEIQAEGALPYDTILSVEKGEETETSIAYDIALEDPNGDPVHPTGDVTVTIPVPESLAGADNYYVYYQNGDNLTDMNATYEDGYVSFTTTHFSTYILSTVDLTEDDTTGGNGGNTNTGSGNNNTSTGTGGTSTGTTNTDNTDTTAPDETQPATSVPDTTPDGGEGGEAGAGNNGGSNGDNPHTGVTLLVIPTITAAAALLLSKKRS